MNPLLVGTRSFRRLLLLLMLLMCARDQPAYMPGYMGKDKKVIRFVYRIQIRSDPATRVCSP